MRVLVSVIATLLLFGACSLDLPIGQTEQGIHSWNGYHWPSSNLSLSVYDNMKDSAWAPSFEQTLADWNALAMPLSLAKASNKSADIAATARRSNQWLGMAQIYLDSDGHILSGKLTVNPILLSSSDYSPEAAQHVFCQEMGHILGLEHTVADSCMDDCAWAATRPEWLACLNSSLSTGPDSHDEGQLNTIYDHKDAGEPEEPDAGGNGPNCGKSPKNPHCPAGGWMTVHSFPIE